MSARGIMPGAAPARDRSPGRTRLSFRLPRRIAQAVALLLFLALAVMAVHPVRSPLPVDLFLRLDPLIALAASVGGGALATHALWAVPTAVVTIIIGRFFCGWLCPLGTVLDLLAPRRPKLAATTDRALRPLKYVLLGTIVVAAVLGNLTLLVFDPLSLLTRTLATALLPGLSIALTDLQAWLYNTPLPDGGLAAWLALSMEDAFRGNLLPYEPRLMRQGIVMLSLFAALLALTAYAPRFWCRYLCPLGALLGLLGRAGMLGRRVQSSCTACGRCRQACPMGAIKPDSFASRPGECIQCARCRSVCAPASITFGTGQHLPRYEPSRRHFLAAVGAGVAGVAVLRVDPTQRHADPELVRPPGALS